MSAYNQARYNISPYNINAGGLIWLNGESKSEFKFSFSGQTYLCFGNLRVAFITTNVNIDKGRVFRGNASETFSADTSIIGFFNLSGGAGETFDVEKINMSQEAHAHGDSAENVTASMNLSQEVNATGNAVSSSDIVKLNLSQTVWESADTGEVFQATADIIAQTEYVCEFPGLTLRPGQVLVIDANTYNVLLDGENAIHLQSGDWLDKLSRNTQNIVISGNGASRLSAEILYTEKYL